MNIEEAILEAKKYEWAKYITISENGNIYVYENEPVKDGYGDYLPTMGEMKKLGNITPTKIKIER